MPFADYDDFEACVRDNQDKSDPDAYCGAIKDQVENSDHSATDILNTAEKYNVRPDTAVEVLNQSLQLDDGDPCWEGYTMVGTKTGPNGEEVPRCVPDDDVPDANMADAEESDCPDGQVEVNGNCVDVENVITPPSVVNSRVMASRSLEIGPMERVENGDTVRYNNISLLGQGVWTDQASKTPTLYDQQTLENIEPEYNSSEHNGPPVNIMHDLSQNGEPNEASIGGYIDPKSLTAEGGKLYGDIVLDTTTAAGDFADENLQSALESNGQVGFGGPSVELDVPREHLAPATDHPEAEEHVEKGLLTGTGLVMDPASKNISFDAETAARGVAMAASGDTNKTTHVLTRNMSRELADPGELREILDMFGADVEELDDEEVMDMAEDLHEDLMEELQADVENEEHGDEDMEDDEEEEDENMGDYSMEDMEEMAEQLEELRERLAELESEMGNTASMSDVKSELSELAEADTVEELDKRLQNLEEQPEDSKTLAEGNTEADWEPTYTGDYSPNAGL